MRRDPFTDILDPYYIGTGPGAARRRYAIAALADELQRAADRKAMHLRELDSLGKQGGGPLGWVSRLGTQGATMVGNIPGGTKLLVEALGKGGLGIFGRPGGDFGPAKELVGSYAESIKQDVTHPIDAIVNRPGYLAADIASIALPVYGGLARFALGGRVALRGSAALAEEQPMLGPTTRIVETPKRRRGPVTATGRPAAAIPGETVPTAVDAKVAALHDVSRDLGNSLKEKDYIDWLGDQGPKYVEAVRDTPNPEFNVTVNAKGHRALQHVAANGDMIEVEIPKQWELNKGHLVVRHHPADAASATGFGKPTDLMRVKPTEESNGFPLAHFGAVISAKDLALRAAGHKEVKSDFSINLSHDFREHAAVPLVDALGEAGVRPVGSEVANVLGTTEHVTSFGSHSHELLDQVKKMTDRRAKPETVMKKLGFESVEAAQAAMDNAAHRTAEVAKAKAIVAAKEAMTGVPAEDVLAAAKETREQMTRGALKAQVKAQAEEAAAQETRNVAAREARDVAGEPITEMPQQLVAHAVQHLRDNPSVTAPKMFAHLEETLAKAGLPGLAIKPAEVMKQVRAAKKTAEEAAVRRPEEGIVGRPLNKVSAAAKKEAIIALRQNSAISAPALRKIIARHHPEGVGASNAQVMTWVRGAAEKARAGEPVVDLAKHPLEDSHSLIVEAGRQIYQANKEIDAETLRKQATEVAKSLAEERGVKGRKGVRVTLPRTIKTKDLMEAVTGETQVSTAAKLRPMEDIPKLQKEMSAGNKRSATELRNRMMFAKKHGYEEEFLKIEHAYKTAKAAAEGKPEPPKVTKRTEEFAKAGVRETKREDLDMRLKRMESDAKKKGQVPTRDEYATVFAQTLGPKMGPKAFEKWEENRGPAEPAAPPEDVTPIEPGPVRETPRSKGEDRRTEGTTDRERRINPRELKAAGVPDDKVGEIATQLRAMIDDAEAVGIDIAEIDPYDYADVFTSHLGEEVGQAAFLKWGGPSGGAPGGEPLGYRLRLAAGAMIRPPSPGVILHGYETFTEKQAGGLTRETTVPQFTLKSRSPVVRAGQKLKYNLMPKIAPTWFAKRMEKHVAKETGFIRKMVETNFAIQELRTHAQEQYEAAGKTGPTPHEIMKQHLDKVVDESYEKWVNSGKQGKWSDLVDTGNQMAVVGALMTKPAYLGANLIGQMEVMMVDHAWNPVSVAKSAILQQRTFAKFPELQLEVLFGARDAGFMESFGYQRGSSGRFGRGVNRVYRGLAQEGVSAFGYGVKKGGKVGVTVGKGGKVYPAAEWVLDNRWRENAFFNEARRQGYRTPEAIHELMTSTDQAVSGKRLEIFARSNRNAVEYGRLTPSERDFWRRIVFFYPWLKASTRWTLRSLTEHPVTQGARLASAHAAAERNQRELGFMPSFMLGAFKIGDVQDTAVGQKLPLLFNPQAVASTGALAQLSQTVGEAAGGYEAGTGKLAQYLNPFVQSGITQATGYDPFTGRQIPASEGFKLPIPGISDRTLVPGPLGGRALNTFTGAFAPLSLAGDVERLQKTRSGQYGDISQVLLPMTPSERWGRFLGPGAGAIVGHPFAEYRYNPKVGQAKAFAEAVSGENVIKREVYKHREFYKSMTEAAREAGVLGPSERFQPEVQQALIARGRRTGEIAQFKRKLGRSLNSREVLTADVGLLVNMKKLTRQEGADLVHEALGMDDSEIQSLDQNLRDENLGGGILSEYLQEINAGLTDAGKKPISLP